jgi:hypothetical protein
MTKHASDLKWELIMREIKGLCGSSAHIVEAYLSQFYDNSSERHIDESEDELQKRLRKDLLHRLASDRIIDEQGFKKALSRVLNEMWNFACEFPGVEKQFGEIVVDASNGTFCKDWSFSITEDIKVAENVEDPDEREMILEFHEQLADSLKDLGHTNIDGYLKKINHLKN